MLDLLKVVKVRFGKTIIATVQPCWGSYANSCRHSHATVSYFRKRNSESMNEQQNHCCAATCTCTMLRCPDHLYSTKSIRNCDFENIIFTVPKSDLIATCKAPRVTRKPLRGGESGKVRCESPKTFSKSPLQGRITARTVTTKTIVFVVTSRWNPLAVASFRIWLLGLFPPLWELSG